MSETDMLARVLGWGTVALGVILTVAAVRATLYFKRHHDQLEGSRGEWVHAIVYRTVVTITIGCLVLTLARVYTLLFGSAIWTPVIGGVAVTWILSIPWLTMGAFRAHEGEDLGYVETATQREDRVAGDQRRRDEGT